MRSYNLCESITLSTECLSRLSCRGSYFLIIRDLDLVTIPSSLLLRLRLLPITPPPPPADTWAEVILVCSLASRSPPIPLVICCPPLIPDAVPRWGRVIELCTWRDPEGSAPPWTAGCDVVVGGVPPACNHNTTFTYCHKLSQSRNQPFYGR